MTNSDARGLLSRSIGASVIVTRTFATLTRSHAMRIRTTLAAAA